jgi:hypothetical protein
LTIAVCSTPMIRSAQTNKSMIINASCFRHHFRAVLLWIMAQLSGQPQSHLGSAQSFCMIFVCTHIPHACMHNICVCITNSKVHTHIYIIKYINAYIIVVVPITWCTCTYALCTPSNVANHMITSNISAILRLYLSLAGCRGMALAVLNLFEATSMISGVMIGWSVALAPAMHGVSLFFFPPHRRCHRRRHRAIIIIPMKHCESIHAELRCCCTLKIFTRTLFICKPPQPTQGKINSFFRWGSSRTSFYETNQVTLLPFFCPLNYAACSKWGWGAAWGQISAGQQFRTGRSMNIPCVTDMMRLS